ncbi:TetR/AcrR family transcriptional regulator [Hyphobacterium sp. SN044]|uniref:TetR/AcrR family transcriptional regulator n=1 Tax=Hyphobacterium sp. SN044 TaxID=2912575 RepID=UPI001F3FC39E|nr:TetR/AcrR family transcriptional regulator [Hyphobacterium sp. SN044]MCF8878669.1 TetR/AcrR family transcriptional regulator [Hyphobacterium sp. SN044]
MTADNRRDALIDRLADHMLAKGIGASSLRALAKAAGTSDRMLLYYFRDKDELVAATLERIAARFSGALDAFAPDTPLPYEAMLAHLAPVLLDEAGWPYMRVWLEIASRSANGDKACRAAGEAIGRDFHAWGAAHLDSSPGRRERDAASLFATLEGMVLLKALGLEDVSRIAAG